MQRVALAASNWGATGYLARTFSDRLFGVRRVPHGSVVVLSTTSVHSLGLRGTLDLIGVDDRMRVVATMPLPPNRVRVIPSARLIVEIPAGGPLPEVGDQIEIEYG
ncbi:MAG TPA: hypothetical protein VHM29_06410 [Acidimicrobiia bacterium]|jgi:hypothetical protein|nr:hypothetical protein [Acidimicrobiia bacterium]